MAILLLNFRVQDYDEWRKVFEANVELRRQAGCTGTHIFQNAHDPNEVIVNLQWDSEENAGRFLGSPEGKAARDAAGVIGEPRSWYLSDGGRTPG